MGWMPTGKRSNASICAIICNKFVSVCDKKEGFAPSFCVLLLERITAHVGEWYGALLDDVHVDEPRPSVLFDFRDFEFCSSLDKDFTLVAEVSLPGDAVPASAVSSSVS